MESQHSETVGQFVARHRTAAGLTQSKLGELAGYEKGAGVSISRIETGKLIPNANRTNMIADALCLSNDERTLFHSMQATETAAADAARAPMTKQGLANRKATVNTLIAQRVQITEALAQKHQEAVELASTGFFNELVVLASEVNGVPIEQLPSFRAPQLHHLVDEQPQIQLISNNIAKAFIGEAGKILITTIRGAGAGLLAGGLTAYANYLAEAQFGTASTGRPISSLQGVARSNALLANIGGGALKVGGNGIAGGQRAIVGTIGTALVLGAATALTAAAIQTYNERQEALRQISAQEAELARTEQRFDYWRETIRRSTDLLTYIGIHGAHALDKWKKEISAFPTDWADLTPAQKSKFIEMLTIAACETTVDLSPIEQIMTCSDADLDIVTTELDDTISAAETIVRVIV